MDKLNRSQFLRRMGAVVLTAGAVGFLIDGIFVMWYLWPIEAPHIIANYLFAVFVLAFVIVMPCLLITRLIVGRRKWRIALTTVSLLGLASTMAALDVSYGDSFVDMGPSLTSLTLGNGWVYLTRYGPAPPRRRGSLPGATHLPVWSVELPLFVPLVLFAIIPGVELRHWVRRRRRRRNGVCEDCGYDLRGAMKTCSECGTHVGRCPECGIVVVKAGRFHAAAPC
ncbi:MAG: zinc ribbon domain-containing protein [Planctomycetes bacterium]|nr:zinc ribbon domain-containing protein [Planctomycetota bacterium]